MKKKMRAFTTVLLLALALGGCKKTVRQDVAATVNDRPITYAELDKQYRIQFANPAERPTDDQMKIQKLELLRNLIDAEIMLQRADKLGLTASDTDVEAKLNELRAPYTQEEFQRQLQSRSLTPDELKSQLRRELSIDKLFNKEVKNGIVISEKDIAEFYNANRASFNLAEPRIHMAQIVVTNNPDPSVRNLRNDKAQNPDQARQKVQMILDRLRQGQDFGQLAQNYSEDPNTAPNGGDLGFVAETALEKASPDLRKLISGMQPGQVSQPISTGQGFQVFKVIAKEPAGQRELSDPRVQNNIRELLMNRKEQLQRTAYYEVARNEAKVSNYYAQQLTR